MRNLWRVVTVAVVGQLLLSAAIADSRSGLAGKKTGAADMTQAATETSSSAAGEADLLSSIRAELRAGKTELIAKNISFADAGKARDFWALYRDYEKDLKALNDEHLGVIRDYLDSVDTLTDDKASGLLERTLDVREEQLALRRKYVEAISKKVSPITAARFLQVEAAVQSILDAEIIAGLPLVKAEAVR